ncbi:MAG: hypothetical protein J2P37_24565 [Ktedonobacteraceae bacterium]|nr:hypothetical protein [Ktedonobacteraceae bacterium]MBO0796980.1 hypothetical protein [Ktedonobacteraceae bacterium]
MDRSTSEVARLRQQIETECQAMKQALEGYAVTASHDVINRRYKALDNYHTQLKGLVGESKATAILYEIYNRIIQ